MKRFNVVIPKESGSLEVYPMKEWLRQHQDSVPAGLSATQSTSHQLRNGLRKIGWQVQETDTEVRLIPPGEEVSASELDAVLGNADEEEQEPDDGDKQAFGLEYQLRDFLAENIQTVPVNDKKLKLFVDQAGRDGIEYPTAIGPIDILAVDEEGNFYIFELKRSSGSDKVVGQVTRYMGWVSQTIGKGKTVTGVIVAKAIDDKMRYAATVIPQVYLFEYRVEFHLKEANSIRG